MRQQVKILGNKIDCFDDYSGFFSFVSSELEEKRAKGYVTVNNVHTMMEGYRDKHYQAIINGSYLAIPDGKPLSVVGRLKGQKAISRLFGPTVMEHFIDWGRNQGHAHFFFGSSESTLEKLKKAINDKYPGAKVAGMISPPYQPVDRWDNDVFLKIINEANPDFIWIGLGAPKQERWMAANFHKLNRGLMFGIGAGFDYLAGNTQHAPEWMKNASLEWLYRLSQEPKRLWKRYLTTIPPFIILTAAELLREKIGNKKM